MRGARGRAPRFAHNRGVTTTRRLPPKVRVAHSPAYFPIKRPQTGARRPQPTPPKLGAEGMLIASHVSRRGRTSPFGDPLSRHRRLLPPHGGGPGRYGASPGRLSRRDCAPRRAARRSHRHFTSSNFLAEFPRRKTSFDCPTTTDRDKVSPSAAPADWRQLKWSQTRCGSSWIATLGSDRGRRPGRRLGPSPMAADRVERCLAAIRKSDHAPGDCLNSSRQEADTTTNRQWQNPPAVYRPRPSS